MELVAPFLARIAGLPAGTLDGFGSNLCTPGIHKPPLWQRELREARSTMVDRLYSLIHGSSPELRRFLLAVKRDCFNGRSLGKYRGAPQWELLRELAGALVDRILQLEEQIERWTAEFEAAYFTEQMREHRHLLRVLEDLPLLRGISLGIPLQLRDLDRLRGTSNCPCGYKEAKLELILLRYVSRAARKLSPYSTLTRMALGSVRSDLKPGGIQLLGSTWRELSLLRLKRYLLDQWRDALLRYPQFRNCMPVTLNETVEEIAPDRYRLLRPGHWALDQESGCWQFFQDSLVQVTLRGPVIARLQGDLARRRSIYSELTASLERELPGQESARQVDRLLQIGFLCFVSPWPGNEGQAETRMLAYLRSLPGDAGLECVGACLERILALESAFPETADPAGSVREIERLLDEMWQAVGLLAGLSPQAKPKRGTRGSFYEDVFLLQSDDGNARQEIVQLPHATAENLARTLEPMVRLSNLFNHRHDFLHAIAALMAERWPGRQDVPVLELFSMTQPLWREYRSFLTAARQPGGWKSSFNPMGLESMAELHHLRDVAWESFGSCLKASPGELRISGEAVTALLEGSPERYLSSIGSTLLLQQADREGDAWVLNRMYEGTGRYGSRFTPVMEEAIRQRYTAHFTACSSFEQDGGMVELLDLMCPQGDTLNVHVVQTPRILAMPGEDFDLPPDRQVRLDELRVRLEGATSLPRLVDSSGRTYLPVHLGGASHAFMPMLIRFLALFGPGEFRSVFPDRKVPRSSELGIWERLTISNVILMRRRWFFPSATLRERIAGLPESEAFVEINRWRMTWDIPERVFLLERIRHRVLADRYKPQYLDFTSPLFLGIFRLALDAGDPLALEEILPAPEALPCDTTGKRWAVELLLDTLTLGSSSSTSPTRAHCGSFL